MEEIEKIKGGEILKLGNLYYLVGEKCTKIKFKLWRCDENGKKIGKNNTEVRLTDYNFEVFARPTSKKLEEAIEF